MGKSQLRVNPYSLNPFNLEIQSVTPISPILNYNSHSSTASLPPRGPISIESVLLRSLQLFQAALPLGVLKSLLLFISTLASRFLLCRPGVRSRSLCFWRLPGHHRLLRPTHPNRSRGGGPRLLKLCDGLFESLALHRPLFERA